jgi:PAS domain S-box-containing protein
MARSASIIGSFRAAFVESMESTDIQATLKRYAEQRRLLDAVSKRIAASGGLDETLPHILTGICQATKAIGARIILEKNGKLQSFAMGPQADALAGADQTLHQYLHQHKTPQIINVSTPPDGLTLAGLDVASTIVLLPLETENRRYGTLWVAFKNSYTMSDDEQEFLELLALQATIAITNAQAFDAVRAGQEQLAAILASAMDAIIMVDGEGKTQVFNPSAESLFGIKATEAIGKPFDTIIQDETLLNLMNPDAESADNAEYEAGDGRTYSPHVSTVTNENGSLNGYLLVLRDVTRFKHLVENMSQFLYTVSHDLRSPLTAAKGFVDMLPMVGELNEKQSTMQTKILTGIVDMTNLVEKVLDAGRLDPEMGNYELRRETCDPTEIVRKVHTTMNGAAEKKDISLNLKVDEGVPAVKLDEMMLERALTNLVENAIKYSPEGTTVTITAGVNKDNLFFSVSDNGYGIPEEDQKRLFERGQRIRRREHRTVRGSGLGLFIVKNVAQQHGGNATLESKVGEGSTFTIQIPLFQNQHHKAEDSSA